MFILWPQLIEGGSLPLASCRWGGKFHWQFGHIHIPTKPSFDPYVYWRSFPQGLFQPKEGSFGCQAYNSHLPTISVAFNPQMSSGWWFQPIWKIAVKMGIFPKQGWKFKKIEITTQSSFILNTWNLRVSRGVFPWATLPPPRLHVSSPNAFQQFPAPQNE